MHTRPPQHQSPAAWVTLASLLVVSIVSSARGQSDDMPIVPRVMQTESRGHEDVRSSAAQDTVEASVNGAYRRKWHLARSFNEAFSKVLPRETIGDQDATGALEIALRWQGAAIREAILSISVFRDKTGPHNSALAAQFVVVRDLCRELPRGEVLLDFVEFQRNYEGGPELGVLAFTKCASKQPKVRFQTLGPARDLEKLVVGWRAAVVEVERCIKRCKQDANVCAGRCPSQLKEMDDRGASIRAATLDRIMSSLPRIGKRIWVVLDGPLKSVPLASLPDGHDPRRYLAEKWFFQYLTAPVDLGVMTETRAAESPPLVVVDVDYDVASKEQPRSLMKAASNPNCRPSNTDSLSLPSSRIPWSRLEDEHRDLEASVAKAFKKAPATLEGSAASKANVLQAAQGRPLMHLFTHGIASPLKTLDSGDSDSATCALSRSGIVLAGANHMTNGTDESAGILSALEILSTDLSGNQLTVLSACSTAQGEESSGEPPLALSTAVLMAGSESVIAAQWKIGPQPTLEFFKTFYDNAQVSDGRLEDDTTTLLTRVQRDLAKRYRTGGIQHSAWLWGAFVAIRASKQPNAAR